jgi:hypothetical protein
MLGPYKRRAPVDRHAPQSPSKDGRLSPYEDSPRRACERIISRYISSIHRQRGDARGIFIDMTDLSF